MASTDTRSGFRLPWSTDRAQDDTTVQDAGDGTPESATAHTGSSVAWLDSDLESRAGFQMGRQRPPEAALATPQEAPTVPTEPPVAAPRKPSKLMADLAVAIRATAEAAREQRLGQLEADANGIIELIRAQSDEGAVALRRRSDEDVAAIRDWAKAEIARIKEQSETKIADRKHLLEQEVADHAAAIEDRCAEVQSTVAGYREAMSAYFERLQAEEDPARLATMAEAMPDPPALAALSELDDLPVDGAAARHAAADSNEAVATAEAEPEAVASPDTDGSDDEGEIEISDDRIAHALGISSGAVEVDAAAEATSDPGVDGEALVADRADEATRWISGETPDGFPVPSEGGEPVDRGAIMAALEAAAEAVVAAESAAESAETAEAAADVAETAAELVAGRGGTRDEADPGAQAALSARVDAGGFETESYQDRLASLLPGHAEGGDAGDPRTTQVVVTGLVSVASIASFKRHLGRLAGVAAVAVASGPDGEFIFNVTHRPDVSFRDAIPTMPGFAARVVGSGDGVVSVTAHDPETEG